MASQGKNSMDRADLVSHTFSAEIPPADGQPGISLLWPQPMQPALDDGIRRAQYWLELRGERSLWSAFFNGQSHLSEQNDRAAFSIGFLMRLQQRLRSSSM